MVWLIGIICLILIVVFWRVFLPIAVIAFLGVGLFSWNMEYQQEQEIIQAEKQKKQLKSKIADAQKNASAEGKEWEIFFEKDPATDAKVARTASIVSNDGLCYLSVQERLNGARLTGIDCWGIKLNSYENIDVKFDSDKFSTSMRLEKYSDGEGVYIPSFQYEYSRQLNYEDFISRIKTSKSLAINIPAEEPFWTAFSLKNAAETVEKLGTQKNSEN